MTSVPLDRLGGRDSMASSGLEAQAEAASSLVQVLARALERRGYDLSVAESCTGGALGAAITDLPGASRFFAGGVIAYSNDVKERLLGVPAEMLREHGAVSERTVRSMAEGVRERLGTSVGVAITGIAGPDGGSMEKPVGLVYVAVATPEDVRVARQVWSGDRSAIREAAVRAALELTLRTVGDGP